MRAAARNANLLLNIGPDGSGQIPARAVEVFDGIGKWFDKNGDSVYGTTAGDVPFDAPPGDTRRQWSNCHALSINGKQSNITDEDLLAVAARYSIGTAPKVLKQIKTVFESLPETGVCTT